MGFSLGWVGGNVLRRGLVTRLLALHNLYIPQLIIARIMKSLADTKEWKKLRKKIEEARKDPKFRAFIRKFIEATSHTHR